MREHAIREAILSLAGWAFENFAVGLLQRELYPALNPTSRSHDFGEDARTERSTVVQHNGLKVSVFAAKSGGLTKLTSDCALCEKNKLLIDVVVFATTKNPRTDTQKDWRDQVQEAFGWKLEVRTLSWLTSAASKPEYEGFVDDHLNVPPPNGDYLGTIQRELSRHTDSALGTVRLKIPGIDNTVPRTEVAHIEDQLARDLPVLLTGSAGSGKSGIGRMLAQSAKEKRKIVLFLDARRVSGAGSEADLRRHLGLNGPIVSALARAGRHSRCRLILDQLDNVAGSPSATVLVDLAQECCQRQGVDVVVISRKQGRYEKQLLRRLSDSGFAELTSFPLSEERTKEILNELGVLSPSPELVSLGSNLLNLELIGAIREEHPERDLSTLTAEVDLWEAYREALLQREEVGYHPRLAEHVLAEAVALARAGLKDPEGSFIVEFPPSREQQRLESWEVIQCEGRVCRFRHETVQDYFYAWNAVEKNLMPSAVIDEIGAVHTLNVFPWMDKLYARRDSVLHEQFLTEALGV
jgi:hypothetical protein